MAVKALIIGLNSLLCARGNRRKSIFCKHMSVKAGSIDSGQPKKFADFAVDQGGMPARWANKGGVWYFIGSIEEVPTDCDLHLAAVDKYELHALVFPCRRLGNSWIDAKTQQPIEIRPTHWQEWPQN